VQNKKKILITGSNGLLGQKLVKLLKEKGDFDFVATARGNNRIQDKEGFIFKPMDVTDKTEVMKIITDEQPDYVIHTAAMTNVDQCEIEKESCTLLNVNAVEYLIKACEKNNVHFTHLSTDFIFDGTEGPYDEESAIPKPLSYYGESKLKSEKIIFKSTCDWAIVRTVLVYGITVGMSRSNIILWVKNSLEEGKDIHVVTDQFRSPTLAEDLAMGCYLIVKQHAKGIYNISGKEVLTPYKMAIKTAKYFKLDESLIHKTDGFKFQQTAKRPSKTGFIIEKAKKELGYKPHSFDEGIALLHQQIQNQ